MNDRRDSPDRPPHTVRLAGALTLARVESFTQDIEGARRHHGPLVLDLSEVSHIDPIVAVDIMMMLRRKLRHGDEVAIVTSAGPAGAIGDARSLAGVHFCDSLEEALEKLGR